MIWKIGQKVPQMAPVQLDQGANVDKSFWTWPFRLGFFGDLFGWFFLLSFLLVNNILTTTKYDLIYVYIIY
jgi:hypothetical protein